MSIRVYKLIYSNILKQVKSYLVLEESVKFGGRYRVKEKVVGYESFISIENERLKSGC